MSTDTLERFPNGAIVRTLADDGSGGWTDEALKERAAVPRGIEGYVRESSDRHGLCYRVDHIGRGALAWYSHAELEQVLPGETEDEDEDEIGPGDELCPICKNSALGEDGRCNAVECPSYEQIDTDYINGKVLCPWCGEEQGDIFEIDGIYIDGDDVRMHCGTCERPFDSVCSVTYEFSTTRIDEAAEAIEKAEEKVKEAERLAERYAGCAAFSPGARIRVTVERYADWIRGRVGTVNDTPISQHNPFVHVTLDDDPQRDLRPYVMSFFPDELERVDVPTDHVEEPVG